MGHIYTLEYYSPINKNEILPFAATWMNLEIIMPSEVSQTEKGKCIICYLYEKPKRSDTEELTYKADTQM